MLNQVVREALYLKGAMGSEAGISYACTCTVLAGWKWKRLRMHLTEDLLRCALFQRGVSKAATFTITS